MFEKLSLKEAVIGAIQGLPNDCTIDEIINEIKSFSALVEGFKDVERGKFITSEELIHRIGDNKKF